MNINTTIVPVEDGVKTICFPSVGHWGDMGFATAFLTDKKQRSGYRRVFMVEVWVRSRVGKGS